MHCGSLMIKLTGMCWPGRVKSTPVNALLACLLIYSAIRLFI